MRVSKVDPNLEDSDNESISSVHMRDVDANLDSSDDEADLVGKPYVEMARYTIPAPLYNSEKVISKVKLVPDRELNDLDSAMSYMTDFADTLISDLCGNLRENDLMRIELECQSLHKPISTALLPKRQFSTSYFLSLIGRVLQSDESIFMGQEITVACEKVREPMVGVSNKAEVRQQLSQNEATLRRKCVISISTEHNLCLSAAISVGRQLISHQYKKACTRIPELYRTVAVYEKVYGRRPDETEDGGLCPLDDLDRFQAAFANEFQIRVYQWPPGPPMYVGNSSAKERVNLLYCPVRQHVDVLTSVAAIHNESYYCEQCETSYSHTDEHSCVYLCPACYRPDAQCRGNETRSKMPNDSRYVCKECRRSFFSDTCFSAHIGEVCKKHRRCPQCHRDIGEQISHPPEECGQMICNVCGEFVNTDHLCFMQVPEQTDRPIDREREADQDEDKSGDFLDECESVDGSEASDCAEIPSREDPQYYQKWLTMNRHCYFDFEATAEPEANGQHAINAAVAIINWAKPGEQNTFRFWGDDALDQFCRFAVCKEHEDVVFVAHNGARYDFIFIYKYFLEQGSVAPEPLIAGTSIIQLTFPTYGIRFIDSFKYISRGLSAIPGMFSMEDVVMKGYFPHAFNLRENYDYVGPVPDKKYFRPDFMAADVRKQFKQWHAEQLAGGVVWNFQEEIMKYCENDTLVLKSVFEAFRLLCMQETDIDATAEPCMTIASLTNRVFRVKHLKPDTIAIIPRGGYHSRSNQSHVAKEWLFWLEHSEGRKIRHSGNSTSEYKVALTDGRKLKVDGVALDVATGEADRKLSRVYEFLGDHWHGCPEHNNMSDFNRVRMLKYRELYEEWISRKRDLEDCGFNVKFIWECEWSKLKKENAAIADFIKHLSLVAPLNPRDGYAGGRTNAARLFWQCTDDEIAFYIDFCSLYPDRMRYCEYPIGKSSVSHGHPVILLTPEECDPRNLDKWFGMIKLTILPPRNVLHPALWLKANGRLMFPCCYSCAMELNTDECMHTEEERMIVEATYTVDEVRYAVYVQGYKIVKIHEVWHYEEKSGEVFTSFVTAWLRVKTENAGYPREDMTEQEKAEYVNDYFRHEGIMLRPSRIRKNRGLYNLSKIFLNAAYGKLGQAGGKVNHQIFTDALSFWKFCNSSDHTISGLMFFRDKVQVSYTNHSDIDALSSNTNVVYAAMITANARLKLLRVLDNLGDRCLYFDTDSIIYTSRPGEWNPVTGRFLGDFTDELNEGEHITTFASAGPKNYSFRTNKNREIIKVRGFTIRDGTASARLNMSLMEAMILRAEPQQRMIARVLKQKKRTKNDVASDRWVEQIEMGETLIRDNSLGIVTAPFTRKYEVCYVKRRIVNGFHTLPWGHRGHT